MRALTVSNLSYTYPDGTRALKNLSLQVERGKKTALLGANGSGKTTLLYHLNGLLQPQEGEVEVMGYRVNGQNLRAIRSKAGLLFDNPDNQLFATTVFQDVAFGPRNLSIDEKKVEERVESSLKQVGAADLTTKPPYYLSMGQKKKVALAGILAMKPALLLFDEPFSGLDPASIRELFNILKGISQNGGNIIISTHDVDRGYAWAEEVIIMSKGQVLAKGPVDLLRDDKLVKAADLESPTLAKVFADTEMKPRTASQARTMLKSRIKLTKGTSKKVL